MLKKLYGIAALFVALFSCASSFGTQMEVDEQKKNHHAKSTSKNEVIKYSDEKPKSKCVFSFKSNLGIDDVCTGEIDEHISKTLKENNFIELKLRSLYGDLVFLKKKDNEEEFDYIFLGIRTSNLKKVTRELHNSSGKWSYPRVIEYSTGEEKELNEFSWAYVDHIIHDCPNVDWGFFTTYFGYDQAEEKIFNHVKENGLENTFKRILVIPTEENILNFYTIYNTKEDLNTGEEFINKTIKTFFLKND